MFDNRSSVGLPYKRVQCCTIRPRVVLWHYLVIEGSVGVQSLVLCGGSHDGKISETVTEGIVNAFQILGEELTDPVCPNAVTSGAPLACVTASAYP